MLPPPGKLAAVHLRGQPGLLAEYAEEIVVIRNADLLADFAVRELGCHKQLGGAADAQGAQILLDAAAVGLLGQPVERGAAHTHRLADFLAGQILLQMLGQVTVEPFSRVALHQPRHLRLADGLRRQAQQITGGPQ